MSGKNLLKPHGSYPRTGYGITFNLMNDGIHVNGKVLLQVGIHLYILILCKQEHIISME